MKFQTATIVAAAHLLSLSVADYTIQNWGCYQLDANGNSQNFDYYAMNPAGAESCDEAREISGTYQEQLSAGDSLNICLQTTTYADIAADGTVAASNDHGESWTCTPSANPTDTVDTCTQGLGGPTCQVTNQWDCVTPVCSGSYEPERKRRSKRVSRVMGEAAKRAEMN
ncbi:hypothetical protein PVAG01_03440 [Phlyctema vagabunda]|uniref:Uncharacterized protein n=1 Tax=Phlyctema vagabunda TaxID=108571 RepID=A0ABR4PLD8_9HELO